MEMEKSLLDTLLETHNSLWVFGYGSLMWNPNFQYSSVEIGYIRGYTRRFWQGNVTFRGTKHTPGRVATLIPTDMGEVWGVAYEVKGKEQIINSLGYLNNRESHNGGYITVIEDFYSRSGTMHKVLVYIATSENDLFLGPSNMTTMATEIILARGQAGTNTEYVLRLAEYIRENIPEDKDSHLFTLEKFILYLKQRTEPMRPSQESPVIALTFDPLVKPVKS